MKRRISNWHQYNQALQNRGSLEIYFPADIAKKWTLSPGGKKGRPRIYSDLAIKVAMQIKILYKLPFRALRGFLVSLFKLWELPLPVPSYSQICRRAKRLKLKGTKLSQTKAQVIVVDSSGVQVYGAGEWLRKMHRSGGRRRWLKIHIGLDPSTGKVLVGKVTSASVGDCTVLPSLLRSAPSSLEEVKADGAYDTYGSYAAISSHGARAVIPPRKNAVYDQDRCDDRQQALAEIEGLGGGEEGRRLWKKFRGYHERSLVESFFSRYKRAFGSRLSSRLYASQRREIFLQLELLNKQAELGLPEYELVVA